MLQADEEDANVASYEPKKQMPTRQAKEADANTPSQGSKCSGLNCKQMPIPLADIQRRNSDAVS